MKSTFRLFIGALTVGLTVLLSGCGQTGPLYLPKPTAAKAAKSGNAKANTPSAAPAAEAASPTTGPVIDTPAGAPATPAPVVPSPAPSTIPVPQQ